MVDGLQKCLIYQVLMVYADSKEDAILKVKVLALRVIADRIEHGE